MKIPSKKAIDVLCKYNPNIPGFGVSAEGIALLRSEGLAFDPIEISHDEAVAWALSEFAACRRESVANAFIVGWAGNMPWLRTAIAAFSVMTHFPQHHFNDDGRGLIMCATCAAYQNEDVDLTFSNRCRWSGTIIGTPTSPTELAFILQQHNLNEPLHPSAGQVAELIALLEIIAGSDADAKPKDLVKRIRGAMKRKMSIEETRALMDTLGYCGILQTQKHTDWLDKFHGYLTPRSSRSSDWAYPVDFWRGSDGVNYEHMKFWFGGHPLVMEYVNQKQAV